MTPPSDAVRIPPLPTSAGKTVQPNTERAAARTLTDFRTDGYAPFGGTPREAASDILRSLVGLSEVLAAAFDDADEQADNSRISQQRDIFTGRAFDAIGKLTSLALFFNEEEE